VYLTRSGGAVSLADEYSDQMEGLTESMKAALRAARAGAFSSP